MNIEAEKLTIANIEIDVVRKDIKNMHLAVYPPNGRVRLAVPSKTDKEVFRLFAISKLGWIKKHVKGFREQERETPRQYVNGESHYYEGKRYLLEIRRAQRTSVKEDGKKLILLTPEDSNKEQRSKAIQEWYRKQLKYKISDLLPKWQAIIGVQAAGWGVRKMKTKWGSCNTDSKTIWLNLELAKKPLVCLEYILVHELVHLHERNHNDNFISYMDEFMPKWRQYRDELNSLPVRHEDWGY